MTQCGALCRAAAHRETLKTNGFDFCAVDIMDEDGDVPLAVPGMEAFLGERGAFAPEHAYTPGWHLTEVSVGKNLLNYDSLVVYMHFKGHPMGGFGGSLKNIAIGCASGKGAARRSDPRSPYRSLECRLRPGCQCATTRLQFSL